MQVLEEAELQDAQNTYGNKPYNELEYDDENHETNSVQISKDIDEADDDLENDDFEAPKKQKFKRHFGNNWVCLFAWGEPLLTIGPHWPLNICMVGTFGLTSYLLLFIIAPLKGFYVEYASWFVAILQMTSYLACAIKNPGIVTARRSAIINKSQIQCFVCRVPKSEGPLYHCDDCDVCVRGYDHHCPWTGKCVAGGNILPFYVFVTMIPIYFVFFMMVMVS